MRWPWSTRVKVIDLGPMTELELAQHQQWHDVLIAGPTTSVVGTRGNDFPGLFYYDPRTQTQHVLTFKGKIDWRACTLDRRVVRRYRNFGRPHLLLGMFSEGKGVGSVRLLCSNSTRVLSLEKSEGQRDAMPNQWEAMDTLLKQSFRLLPLPEPGAPADWEAHAAQCLKTLYDSKIQCKLDSDESQLWIFFETFESTGSSYDRKPDEPYRGTAELICQAGLASSLLTYAATNPRGAKLYEALGRDLTKLLHKFFDEASGIFRSSHNFPVKS